MSRPVIWVVPCYNEAARLDGEAFVSAVDSDPNLTLLFVDDGSTDDTCIRLRELSKRRPEAIRFLSLSRNSGKAEAVRLGLLEALREGASVVGYIDADLATPLDEMQRLTRIVLDRDVDVVIGARVAMLGHAITRNARRHYLGRVFASAASLILGLRVYDTQCGAKLFRRTPALETALGTPFLSRWAFDVELLGRLVSGGAGTPSIEPRRMLEEPLTAWNDVPGSNLHLRDIATAGWDLVRISGDMKRRRKAR